jgi:hypothetical protein
MVTIKFTVSKRGNVATFSCVCADKLRLFDTSKAEI